MRDTCNAKLRKDKAAVNLYHKYWDIAER